MIDIQDILGIRCGIEIKGKIKLCFRCGKTKYQNTSRYYRVKHNITFSEEDYVSGDYKKQLKNDPSTPVIR